MSEPFYPRLCGGTFFTLVTHAMKAHGRSHDNIRGNSTGITEAECFKALIRVFYPALPNLALSTEKSNASNYKKCKNLGDGIIPFSSRFLDYGYGSIFLVDYLPLLGRMNDFVYRFIDVENYGEWLVRALIQLILEDEEIADDMCFQIMPDAKGVEKKELHSVRAVYIQSFLLGIWSVIMREIPDNTVGKETFLRWHPSAREVANGRRHSFVSNIGASIQWSINVRFCEVNNNSGAVSIVDKPEIKLSEQYSHYLETARRKYETVKTIMDVEPKKFYDIYVCNGLKSKQRLRPPISYPTIDSICNISRNIIIVGTGGLGKSMMMRHLMLNTIDRIDYIGKLPIFIYLKDYNSHAVELVDFIFDQFCLLYPEADLEVFRRGLSGGAFVLLLDGLDEINSAYQDQFVQMVSRLVDNYGENDVIISSRQFGNFTCYEKFHEMNLLPFSKQKALNLIDKLEFHPEEPELKNRFRFQLDASLYVSHKAFAENPLLLTFMLMTFERFGEVATQMHTFYGEVYDLLSKRHDALKVGFKRAYKSGLNPDRLKDVFAAFCAYTYVEQQYSFTHTDMEMYLGKVLAQLRDENERRIPVDDIIQDLVSAVCMMFEEGQQYYFMHRSFQEYFCALSFSKQMDEDLENIGMFFEQREKSYIYKDDIVFDMLFAMKPDQVEKYIIMPFIEKLFLLVGNDYWRYVMKVHDGFTYECGEYDSAELQEPNSFLLSFIVGQYGIRTWIKGNSLPFYEDLVDAEYAHQLDENGNIEVVNVNYLDPESLCERNEITGDPIIVGQTLCVDVGEILQNKEYYHALIAAMEKDDFAFKLEYNGIQQLYSRLKAKHQNPDNSLISVI